VRELPPPRCVIAARHRALGLTDAFCTLQAPRRNAYMKASKAETRPRRRAFLTLRMQRLFLRCLRRIRDPLSELGSIRKSLNAIEVYIRNGCGVSASSERPDPLDFLSLSPTVLPGPGASLPSIREGASVSADAPGQVGRRTGGLYSGPTSLVTPLILVSFFVFGPSLSVIYGLTRA
jgi:hypothetical protein